VENSTCCVLQTRNALVSVTIVDADSGDLWYAHYCGRKHTVTSPYIAPLHYPDAQYKLLCDYTYGRRGEISLRMISGYPEPVKVPEEYLLPASGRLITCHNGVTDLRHGLASLIPVRRFSALSILFPRSQRVSENSEANSRRRLVWLETVRVQDPSMIAIHEVQIDALARLS